MPMAFVSRNRSSQPSAPLANRDTLHEARTHLWCKCYDSLGSAMIRNLTSSTRVSADVCSPEKSPQW